MISSPTATPGQPCCCASSSDGSFSRKAFRSSSSPSLGFGRFEKIGIPYPHISAPFVGVVEIACGILLLVGLATRFAAVPLLIDISVAIATTKVPILLHQGFWPAMHESRVDFCMLVGLIAILCIGGGQISCDAKRFMGGE